MKTDSAKSVLRAAVLLAVAVTWASLAQAQTCSVTWIDKSGDGMWSTADNWSTHEVPGPTSDVCIPSDSADARSIPSISVNSIQVSQGAGVVFGSGMVSIATPVTMQGGVTGDYTQTSTGEVIEYWGSGGILNVNGNATLSGYLYVQYSTRVPPKSGSTFTAMTFGSLNGAFTNVSPGTAKYTNHSVVVKFP